MPSAIADRLILTSCCERCDYVRDVNDEPPYSICAASPTGDFECERVQAIERITDQMIEVMEIIAREPNKRLRAEEAEQIATAYDQTLDELGASLNLDAFVRRCNAVRACANCRRRPVEDPSDLWCESCEVAA